jgi:hypothetical protein
MDPSAEPISGATTLSQHQAAAEKKEERPSSAVPAQQPVRYTIVLLMLICSRFHGAG